MKKILPMLLLVGTWALNAQQLPLFDESDSSKKSIEDLGQFKEVTDKANTYFSTRDIHKKGSGYKPFKRWEYHWKHYLKEDGSIAPPEYLWDAWKLKNQLAKTSTVVSNWSDKGPFDQTRKSGQGRINTVVVDPLNDNIIYVGAPAGGLWKSTDAGVNWTPLTDDLPQIGVSGIAIDPNDTDIIYISTGDDDAGDSYSIGVLKSTNGGATWANTGTILGSPTSSNEIVLDPTDSNKIWVATSNGLFLSTDAGTSWSQKQSGHIRDFKLKPGDPNTIYCVSSNTFYRSTDGGTSFQTVSSGLPAANTLGRLRVEVTPAAPSRVYVLAAKPPSQSWAFDGVYTSTDSGAGFTKTLESDDIFRSTQAWYDLAFVISPTDPSMMFVGVLDIWKSTDTGNNFVKLNDWFNPSDPAFTHADIHFMRYYNGVLYAGTDGGVYKSTDNGSTFTDLTQNLSISQFYKVTVSKQSSSKLAGGLQDNGGFAFSNNIWHNYHGGDGMDSAADPNEENTFYGFQQNGGALSVTFNGGLTSNQFFISGPEQGNWVTPLVINKSSELYAGYSNLYKLESAGWKQISNTFFNGRLEAIEIDPSNTNNIFVSNGTTLFISNDKGATFTTKNSSETGITGVNISSIEVHSSNSNIVWVTTSGTGNSQFPSSGYTGGNIYRSDDGGQTFTDITKGLPGEAKFVVRHHPFSSNNSIYVGTALGVYHRNDDTNAWEVFSTNLPNVAVTDLEINPYDDTITASTYGRSVWQSPIPSVTQPSNDADLIQILSPNNSVSCGNINSSINVINNGTNAITALTINFNIDGGDNQTFNWSGNIASNATGTIELPGISASEGSHVFNAEIVQVNDANMSNNTLTSTFDVNESTQGLITYTFGDANPGGSEENGAWSLADDLWQIGTPITSNFNGLIDSGYATNPSGNYSDNTRAYLTSPCYNMTTLENPILRFDMAFDIEINWDVLYMEYSIDEGESWQVLGTANDPNWYNSNFQDPGRVLTIGKQWTGTDATLKEYSYNLSTFSDESSMMFRFVFASDQAVNQEGVIIDNFKVDASAVLGVDDLEASNFAIYPNPSNNIFNIKRGNYLGQNMDVNVYDVTGKLILSRKAIVKNNYALDMSGVSKGVYFARINIDNKSLVKKLILN